MQSSGAAEESEGLGATDLSRRPPGFQEFPLPKLEKVCVIGLGYIGLPTAAMFATHGHEVVGVDVSDRVLSVLRNGDVHIHEPGIREMVQSAIVAGKMRVSEKPEPADAFIIAVPTPIRSQHGRNSGGQAGQALPDADLSYVVQAAESIVPFLQPGNLVVLESTVPPRTTEDVLIPILAESGLMISGVVQDSDVDGAECPALYVAHCPERVLPGRILRELVLNSRIIGGVSQAAAQAARLLYASFVEGELLLTDATTAEMVKLMENTYRDVNIALANELSLVAERVGIDVWEAIDLANHHPRVNILNPGPGVGGHCIAVDPWFIVQCAPGVTRLIETARSVNDGMPEHVVGAVVKSLSRIAAGSALGQQNAAIVACLGLTYKANVDDIRESPAMVVVELLRAAGYEVRAYDPHVALGTVPGQVGSIAAAIEGAQGVVVLTDHNEFRELDTRQLCGNSRFLIDTRNCIQRRTELPQGLSEDATVLPLTHPSALVDRH